jgi:hypothetical protein
MVEGPVLKLQARRQGGRTCRTELLRAAESIRERTGRGAFTRHELVAEVLSGDVDYHLQSIYKTIRRMTRQEPDGGPPELERLGDGRLRML